MKNKKNSIKKITNDNNNIPTVKGQGCKDDCVLWSGKTTTASGCNILFTPKYNLFM